MDDLGKSLPISEGIVDAEQNTNRGEEEKICLNCGTPLTDKFCPHCGQKNIPRRQALGELTENFIGSFFSFESKFFKTIRYLLFKPGFLASEYNAGRRESYYHPARMYVFTSFIYFLLLFSLPDSDEDRNDIVQTDSTEVSADSTKKKKRNFQLTSNEYKSREEYDSVQNTLPPDERDGWLMQKLNYREIDLNKKYKDKDEQFSSDFGDAFAANTPKILFFLLPVFALLLKLLYVRRDFYYSEHLAFTTYFYNFFFTAGIVAMLVDLIPYLDWFSLVVFLAINAYLLIAMKKVYMQSWGKTILKFVLLTGSFGICILLGLFINLLVSVMMI